MIAIKSPRLEGLVIDPRAIERLSHNELLALAGLVDLVKLNVQAIQARRAEEGADRLMTAMLKASVY